MPVKRGVPELTGESRRLLLALQPSLNLCCGIKASRAFLRVDAAHRRVLCNGSFRVRLLEELPVGRGVLPAFGLLQLEQVRWEDTSHKLVLFAYISDADLGHQSLTTLQLCFPQQLISALLVVLALEVVQRVDEVGLIDSCLAMSLLQVEVNLVLRARAYGTHPVFLAAVDEVLGRERVSFPQFAILVALHALSGALISRFKHLV